MDKVIKPTRTLQRYIHRKYGSLFLYDGHFKTDQIILSTVLQLWVTDEELLHKYRSIISDPRFSQILEVVTLQRKRLRIRCPSFMAFTTPNLPLPPLAIFREDVGRAQSQILKRRQHMLAKGLVSEAADIESELARCKSMESVFGYALYLLCMRRVDAYIDKISDTQTYDRKAFEAILRIICRVPPNLTDTLFAQKRLLELSQSQPSAELKLVGRGDLIKTEMIRSLICAEIDDVDLDLAFTLVPKTDSEGWQRPGHNSIGNYQSLGPWHQEAARDAMTALSPESKQGQYYTPICTVFEESPIRYEVFVVARSANHYVMMSARCEDRFVAEMQIGKLLDAGEMTPCPINGGNFHTELEYQRVRSTARSIH